MSIKARTLLLLATTIVLLLAGAWLLFPDESEDPRYSHLIDINAHLYEEFQLGRPLVQEPDGATYPEEDASVNVILEYCRSFDIPDLQATYDGDAKAMSLIKAFADSCFHVDAPLLVYPDERSTYQRAFDDSIVRIEQALSPYGGVPTQPFRHLTTWRDPRATQTPQELRSIVEDTAWAVYHFLSAYEHGCGRPGQPSDCDKIADFVSGIHIMIARCAEADYQDSFRGHSNYDPQLMEPLLTSIQLACRTLRQAQDTLGPPADNEAWLNVVTKARATLEPALPDMNTR